ncbi:MAG: GNAT family N-acetyltransferase [Ferrovum sp.]|nr:GNAT family N-acetyltransferase [Ferrovum sp.]NDU87330.1 GNAT family N-acetyltransferase [Ferrovum sp.]
MPQLERSLQSTRLPRLIFQYARSVEDVRAAQQLRWRVFHEEMGAFLRSPEPGVDQDRFDGLCDHLLLRDTRSNEVVGTYRILNAFQAQKAGGFYSDGEFDLSRLTHLRPHIMEVGRACVHPDYRSGAAITVLWAGLAEYIRSHRVQYLMGCASMSMADGGYSAAALYRQLEQSYGAPADWRVFPHCALPLAALESAREVEVPPLIKAYLRVGALVCGAPAWDADFNTADCLLLLPTESMDHRYSRHFMKQSHGTKHF